MSAAQRSSPYLRLLLVVDSMEVGGAERSVVDLAIALKRRGHAVQVACAVGGPYAPLLTAAGIPLQLLMRRPVKRRLSLRYAWRIRRLLGTDRFDLVHAHCHASAVAAAVATIVGGTPLVVTEHSEAQWQGPVARFWSRWTHHHATSIVAVSTSIEHRIVAQNGVAPRTVVTIANARPRRQAAPRSGPAPLLMPRATDPLIGVIARLHRDKGIDLFLEGLALVQRRHPGVRAIVAGAGPERVALERQARRLAVHVEFTGCLPDAYDLLAHLDLLVVPSRTEGSPLIVLEAMSVGVPLVATCAGSIPQQARHGRDALLVPAEDSVALATAMSALLDHPIQARRLALSAQERVACCFDHDRVVDAVLDIYRTVLLPPLAEQTSRQIGIDFGSLD